MKIKHNIDDQFIEAKVNGKYVKVSAPMVRYSKVEFRTLVRNYGVDLCFTPMILADSFCQNAKARTSEFSTTFGDTPLIVQFAANNREDFVDASKLVYPYSDGVDLNCGCPQKWAMKDGYGCSLLSKPELIQDLVKGIRNNLPCNYSISVKIRIFKELQRTISFCQQLEKCGINFLTVHGRTPSQKSGDNVDTKALKNVCQSVKIPVIANGGVKTLKDANQLYENVQCAGVMAASGLLTNPALFFGAETTPLTCVKLWVNIKNKVRDRITFQCYHHHLVFMLEKVLSKPEKQIFNYLNTFEGVDEFLYSNLIDNVSSDINLSHSLIDYVMCQFDDEITLRHSKKCRGCNRSTHYCTCNKYDSTVCDGKYFSSYVENVDSLDFMDSSIFDDPS